jgi:poly(3-hydroxybutyrate) depolymerase
MRRIALLALLLLAACGESPEPAYSGPTYAIDPARISVSGISAGAYMAGQMHVAHSALVGGAGLIAGGPWGCAENSLTRALEVCTKEGSPDAAALLEAMRAEAAAGRIDDLARLEGSPVWVFRSPVDPLVGQALTDALVEQYRALDAEVTVVGDVAAAHGVPTLETGAACASFESPYLNACDYDAAGEILATVYGDLAPRTEPAGQLAEVPVPGAADAGLLPAAWLYVPPDCAAGEACGLHVFFHGCSQSSELVGDAVVRGAGFNEWADANRLLVLYPQVKSSKLAPMNPLGCFDWWGYTDERYATREGVQVRAVKALLDRLAGRTL